MRDLIDELFRPDSLAADLQRRRKQRRTEFPQRHRELLDAIEANDPESAQGRVAQAEMAHFLTLLQIYSAERGTRQLAIATAAIAVATVGLIAATVALAVITATHR